MDPSALVPGDVILLEEGERVPADIRLIEGALMLDMSALTGESQSVLRSAEQIDVGIPQLEARDLAFMGATCTEGEARGVVFATGMHTELGRIASMSQRVEVEKSPLEREVRRLSWLIAGIAVTLAVAFVPIAHFGADLTLTDSIVFAVGLLAGQVPEGMLPAITLSLAVAVKSLAQAGRGGQAAERRRDARHDGRDLHRQDRHSDREPDATGCRVDGDRRDAT